MRDELIRRQKNAINRSCYGNIDMITQAAMCTTAPVRPVVDFVLVARDVTKQMNKFNCQQAATGWNRELAKLVAFRAKTHRGCVKLDPGVYKIVTQCVTDLDMNSFTKF